MNKNNNVKETADNLLMQIIEYVNKAEADDEEKDKRFKELACSLVTSIVDFNKKEDEILDDINDICLDIRNISMAGVLRYLDGDMTNVKKIYRQ